MIEYESRCREYREGIKEEFNRIEKKVDKEEADRRDAVKEVWGKGIDEIKKNQRASMSLLIITLAGLAMNLLYMLLKG